MSRKITMMMLIALVLWAKAWTTKPSFGRLLDVNNPSHYYLLIRSSFIPDLFENCMLVDSGVPKYWESSQERIFIKQVYSTPSHLSKFGLNYRLNVFITFSCDTISGASELTKIWGEYANSICKFESNAAVNRFFQIVDVSEMNFDGTKFYSGGRGLSRIGFNIDLGDFYFLLFKHFELIQSINLFLPEIDSLAWFNEFQSKLTIGRIHLENDKLRISKSRDCPTCIDNVLFHYSTSRLLEINLSTNISWDQFPMVRYAMQAVEHRLIGDTLGSCKIGTGQNHVYLKLKRFLVDDNWYARVAIKCRDIPRLRDVCFRIRADSTIDRFRICY